MVSVVSRETQRSLPLLPVFLPMLFAFGCLCLPTAPLTSASDGKFALASALMNGCGSISAMIMMLGLTLTRTESPFAKHVRRLAFVLAFSVAAWMIVRHHLMVTNAIASVMDEEQRAAIAAEGDAERRWVILGAFLSLIPTMLGGVIGVRWIEAAKARIRNDESTSAKGSAHVFE